MLIKRHGHEMGVLFVVQSSLFNTSQNLHELCVMIGPIFIDVLLLIRWHCYIRCVISIDKLLKLWFGSVGLKGLLKKVLLIVVGPYL